MAIKEKIEILLSEKFFPETLQILNESYKHSGHMGDDGSGESHFKVIISASKLQGNRLQKHQQIINTLGNIMQQVHALEIVII